MKAEQVLESRATLGEGPAWDDQLKVLYWVDILQRQVHRFDPKSGRDDFIQLEQSVGCVAPRHSGGLVAGLKNSLAALDWETERLETLAGLDDEPEGNRCNDGKCDPGGRFWVGTMDDGERASAGSLYSLDSNGKLRRHLTGLGISNGLAWSPDNRTMYFIDTPTLTVQAFDYVLERGEIKNPRVVVTIPPGAGYPDGMTSDTEGMLWVALWGGAALTRWDPHTGQQLERIDLPALQVTACVFGGDDLTTLYVTTARKGLTPAQLEQYPGSGALFRIETEVRGMPTYPYLG